MTKKSNHTRCEDQFDSFCKTILRNEARDYFRSQQRRRQSEISLEDLTKQELSTLFYIDHYTLPENTFEILGEGITLDNESLIEGLQNLSARQREIVLLSAVFDLNDREICETLSILKRTVQRARVSAIANLQGMYEGERNGLHQYKKK